MNLIVDIGNSRIKAAVIDQGVVLDHTILDEWNCSIIKNWVLKYDISRSIVSSTRGMQEQIIKDIHNIVGHCLNFDPEVKVPLGICYETPHTLGRDRVAAAVGAREIYGDRNFLIVDFGTAITIDLVSKERGFEGGSISAGVMLRFKSLNDYTASLPLCAPEVVEDEYGVGRSTKNAIIRGVMCGICYEIEGYISRFSQKYDKLSVIFVGGDAKFFEKRIKNAIFANQELVFVGLDRILNYNAEQKSY